MRERAAFWDRCAPVYDRFVRRDAAAYAQMIARMRPAVRDRTVLELATGTGWIAKQLVCQARSVEATDASEAMIRTAADVCRGRILRPESMQSAAGSYLH